VDYILIGLGITALCCYFSLGHSTKRHTVRSGDTTVTYETGHEDKKERSVLGAVGLTVALVCFTGPLAPLIALWMAHSESKERATLKMHLEQKNANGSTSIYAETPKTKTNQHLAG
jgi:hypothetical protein